MHKISSNINYDSLKAQVEAKENVYLPLSTSQLIKGKPNFYTDFLSGIITLVPKKNTIDKLRLDFDININISPQTLCMLNIHEYKLHHGNYDGFSKVAGFDMNTLPDNSYLLKLLATQNYNNKVIRNLPAKGFGLSQEWKNVVCQNVLDNIVKSGKVQQEHKVSLDSIQDYITEMSEAAKTYYILKFKLSDMKKRLSAIDQMAKTNGIVKELIGQYKPANMLESVKKKLEVTQKESGAMITENLHK